MKTSINIQFLLILFLAISCSSIQNNNRSISSEPVDVNGLEFKITDTVYQEIRKVSNEILEVCPPETCILIALGRSPTPFMAEIDAVVPNTETIPLNSFRYNKLNNELSPTFERSLTTHFKAVLSKMENFEGKKVVLLDYAQGGSSLFSAQQYLQSFFEHNVSDFELSSLAITGKQNQSINTIHETAKEYGITKYSEIKLSDNGDLGGLLREQFFDRFSRYKQVDTYDWGLFAPTNRQHYELKYFLKDKREALIDSSGSPTSCIDSAFKIISQ